MTASEFLKKAHAAQKVLANRTADLKTRIDQLIELAKTVHDQLDAARALVVDTLVDKDGEVDEIDYGTVEVLENMALPDEDDLRGITESLTDDWGHKMAELEKALGELGEEVIAAKKARR